MEAKVNLNLAAESFELVILLSRQYYVLHFGASVINDDRFTKCLG